MYGRAGWQRARPVPALPGQRGRRRAGARAALGARCPRRSRTAALGLSRGLRCLAGVRCFRLTWGTVLCSRSAAGGPGLHFGLFAAEGLFGIFCAAAIVYYTQYRCPRDLPDSFPVTSAHESLKYKGREASVGIVGETRVTRQIFMRSSLNKIMFLRENFGGEPKYCCCPGLVEQVNEFFPQIIFHDPFLLSLQKVSHCVVCGFPRGYTSVPLKRKL